MAEHTVVVAAPVAMLLRLLFCDWVDQVTPHKVFWQTLLRLWCPRLLNTVVQDQLGLGRNLILTLLPSTLLEQLLVLLLLLQLLPTGDTNVWGLLCGLLLGQLVRRPLGLLEQLFGLLLGRLCEELFEPSQCYQF